MTGKKKATMGFQKAIDLVVEGSTDCETEVESLVDACQKCGFLQGHKVRTKEELPNPRRLKNFLIADAIHVSDRPSRVVVRALHKKGIVRIGDLLDKKPHEIFDDLKVSDTQKLAFVVAIENAGVRFMPTAKSSLAPEI